MEQSINLVSKVKSSTAGDNTQKVFKLVDDISENFEEKLAAVRSKNAPKEKEHIENKGPKVKEEDEKEIEDTEESHDTELVEELADEAKLLDPDDHPEEHDASEEQEEPREEARDEREEHHQHEMHEDAPEELLENSREEHSSEESIENGQENLLEESIQDADELSTLRNREEKAPQEADYKDISRVEKSVERVEKAKPENTAPPLRHFESKKELVSSSKELISNPVEKSEVSKTVSKDEIQAPEIDSPEELLPKEISRESSLRQIAKEEASHEIRSERFLFEGNESADRSGTSTSKEGSLEKILADLNSVAGKIHVKEPQLEAMSPQLLQTITQVSEQFKGSQYLAALTKLSGTDNIQTKALPKATNAFSNPQLESLKEKVMQQVRFHLQLAMRNGIGEVKMRLHPHFLGNMSVKLNLGAKDVSATFLVDNESTKEMLIRGMHTLEQLLHERGIEVEKIHVEVSKEEGLSKENSQGNPQDKKEKMEVRQQWVHSFKQFGEIGSELNLQDDSGTPLNEEENLNIIA